MVFISNKHHLLFSEGCAVFFRDWLDLQYPHRSQNQLWILFEKNFFGKMAPGIYRMIKEERICSYRSRISYEFPFIAARSNYSFLKDKVYPADVIHVSIENLSAIIIFWNHFPLPTEKSMLQKTSTSIIFSETNRAF